MEKRARKTESAEVAVISRYLKGVLSSTGALLVRGSEAYWLNADEMDRLTGEWREFQAKPTAEPEQ